MLAVFKFLSFGCLFLFLLFHDVSVMILFLLVLPNVMHQAQIDSCYLLKLFILIKPAMMGQFGYLYSAHYLTRNRTTKEVSFSHWKRPKSCIMLPLLLKTAVGAKKLEISCQSSQTLSLNIQLRDQCTDFLLFHWSHTSPVSALQSYRWQGLQLGGFCLFPPREFCSQSVKSWSIQRILCVLPFLVVNLKQSKQKSTSC